MLLSKSYILKMSFPATSKVDLANAIITLLKTQEISNISYADGIITYKSDSRIASANRFSPYFSRFSSGEIFINESENIFTLYFHGSQRGLFLLFGFSCLLSPTVFLIFKMPPFLAIAISTIPALGTGFMTYYFLKFSAPGYFAELSKKVENLLVK